MDPGASSGHPVCAPLCPEETGIRLLMIPFLLFPLPQSKSVWVIQRKDSCGSKIRVGFHVCEAVAQVGSTQEGTHQVKATSGSCMPSAGWRGTRERPAASAGYSSQCGQLEEKTLFPRGLRSDALYVLG